MIISTGTDWIKNKSIKYQYRAIRWHGLKNKEFPTSVELERNFKGRASYDILMKKYGDKHVFLWNNVH